MDAVIVVFFFFQAEDGIRDVAVTGVQTCALPIANLIVVVPGIQAIDAPARLQPAAHPERTGGRRVDDLGRYASKLHGVWVHREGRSHQHSGSQTRALERPPSRPE